MNQEQRAALRKAAEGSISDMAPTILQLLDYIETLEKDAARYRWLRSCSEMELKAIVPFEDLKQAVFEGLPNMDNLDEAIDAAMQGETE